MLSFDKKKKEKKRSAAFCSPPVISIVLSSLDHQSGLFLMRRRKPTYTSGSFVELDLTTPPTTPPPTLSLPHSIATCVDKATAN